MRARSIVAGVVGAAVLAAAGGLAAMAAEYARQLVTPARRPDRPSRILAFTGDAVTIQRYSEAGRPGRYGMWFDEDRGYLRVGEVLEQTRVSVTRAVDLIEAGEPAEGMTCRMTGSYWRDPAAAGLAHEDVLVPTALGPMPAWFVPPQAGEPWRDVVILVHGWGASRAEPLRAVPAIARAGWSSLVVTYRNDVGVPAAPDRRYHLGAEEWRDVEAAIGFALERGAERIALAGWSMGGGTVLQMLLRSRLADRVERIVLDSPAIDWWSILRAQGRAASLPAPVAPLTGAIVSSRVASRLVGLAEPIPLSELRAAGFAERLSTPALLIQGDDDPTTPVEAARALAAARPDLIEYAEFPGAGHVRCWNADEARYAGLLTDWLTRAR